MKKKKPIVQIFLLLLSFVAWANTTPKDSTAGFFLANPDAFYFKQNSLAINKIIVETLAKEVVFFETENKTPLKTKTFTKHLPHKTTQLASTTPQKNHPKNNQITQNPWNNSPSSTCASPHSKAVITNTIIKKSQNTAVAHSTAPWQALLDTTRYSEATPSQETTYTFLKFSKHTSRPPPATAGIV